jgi:site-specific DNA recombinase
MTKRAVLYARVSRDDRSNDGRNLSGQLDMGREYAQENSYQIVAELAEDDRGASGAEIDLPQLNRIRDMAHAGEFDVLIVREIDRLSRNLAKQLIVEQELKRDDVKIEYVLGEYPDTPEGNLMKHVRATVAEFEREKIAERMTRGRRLKVKAGHVLVHSSPPYGYRVAEVDGKTSLIVYEPEARIVRLIYNWYVYGDGGGKRLQMYAIARKLTAMAVPTRLDTEPKGGGHKKRGYGEWSRATVAKILRGEVYQGTWHYGKEGGGRDTWLAVSVPPIVDADLWKAAQERRQQNRDRARRSRKYRYLLTGHVRCGRCGTVMNGHPGYWRSKNARGVNLYYRCAAANNRMARAGVTCNMPQFRVDLVDAAVWEYLKALLIDPRALVEGLRAQQEKREQASTPMRERLEVVDGLLDGNRRQLEKLLDLYLASDFPEEILAERKARLEATISALEQERRDLAVQIEAATLSDERVATIKEFAQKVSQGLKAAEGDFEVRRQIIEAMDMQVTLDIEDGAKVAYVRCLVDESCQCLESTNTRGHTSDASTGRPAPRRR